MIHILPSHNGVDELSGAICSALPTVTRRQKILQKGEVAFPQITQQKVTQLILAANSFWPIGQMTNPSSPRV